MADDDTPIQNSPADTADVTASTYTSASTPPPNTPSITSFEAATSTEPTQAPISISAIESSRKQLRRVMVVITLVADK